MFRKLLLFVFISTGITSTNQAQSQNISSQEIKQKLEKLNVLGSVLYFAAHPDDENTKLIAWLAQEKKYKTAYLSLTRGDGGQNLIGTEQGINLGLIRTQELLAARAIDQGEQYFTSAYDFGFSKTHQETFAFWEKETALREAVWLIRKLQPDVIITRFPPDKRGGHGHHQASALLAHEAFIAAADPKKFPEQLNSVSTWQAKRLIWNTANFGGQNNTSNDQLKIEIGDHNPNIGQTYGEISAKSRSQHKSQGFGSATSRGKAIEYFEHVAGSKANKELLDGVNSGWSRIAGTEQIQTLIHQLVKDFDYSQPQKSVNDLFVLQKQIQKIDDKSIWKNQKLEEIHEIILACAGFWASASADQQNYSVGQNIPVHIEAIVQNRDITASIITVNQQAVNHPLNTNTIWRSNNTLKADKSTQPYWLIQPHTLGKFQVPEALIGYPNNPDKPTVNLQLTINGNPIEASIVVKNRYVDPVQGELSQPICIVPAITATTNTAQILSNNRSTNQVQVTFTRHLESTLNPIISVVATKGWEVSPREINLNFGPSNSMTQTLSITPKSGDSEAGKIHFLYNDQPLQSITSIKYDHIPNINWFPTVSIQCQNITLNNPVKRIGYINGAGDLVAQSLQQIGIETTILDESKISQQELTAFDAIIVGVRYFNIGSHANEINKKLIEYVKNGGVVLIQYNVNSRLQTENIGPYPFQIARDRVTEEDAKVTFDPKDRAFNYPNKITEADFKNWVQERGLYFATQIDKKYRTPIQINDKDEPTHNGSLLIGNYGKGKFVYTSLAFFRQLPAGVPGAYRLFVNLLSKEK